MMYNKHVTIYELLRKQMKHQNPKAYKLFTIEMFCEWIATKDEWKFFGTNPNVIKVEKFLLGREVKWIEDGQPYYNINPNIIESTKRFNLKGLTTDMLDIPHYECISINFPSDNDLKSIFYCRGINCKFTVIMTYEKMKIIFGLGVNYETTTLDKMIDDFCNESVKENMILAVKFLCLIKFLSDCPNDDLIEYDVLARDHGEYIHPKTTNERKQELIEKAKRAGKIGYNIGVSERLWYNAPRLSESRESDDSKELNYAHIRTGHLHAVRFGEGKKHVKIMWFRPTVIRPDLPFKE